MRSSLTGIEKGVGERGGRSKGSIRYKNQRSDPPKGGGWHWVECRGIKRYNVDEKDENMGGRCGAFFRHRRKKGSRELVGNSSAVLTRVRGVKRTHQTRKRTGGFSMRRRGRCYIKSFGYLKKEKCGEAENRSYR